MTRGLLPLFLLLLLIPVRAFPQLSPLEKPVSFSWQAVPLSTALDAACAAARLNPSYDNRILPDSLVTATYTDVALGKVLDGLLKPHGLAYAVKKQHLVVYVPGEANRAKREITMSGYVEDRETGERLAGASVYDLRSKRGTLTNEAGFFSLRLPTDSVKLVTSIIGYSVHVERFKATGDFRRVVRMAQDLELAPVVIVEQEDMDNLEELSGVGVVDVSVAELELLPTLLGEPDAFNALKLYPGVHSGGDGSSGLYVRGGGPDQNLVLMDGVPIYNSSHLFGFYSIFNADAIKRIELVKGGFPARYGGRLSSVVGIELKEGNVNKLSGEATVGLAAARLFLEGPIRKEKTSFVLAARRTVMEPFFLIANRIESERDGNRLGYSFYDLNGKITHRFSERDHLFLSFYSGGDRFASGYAIDTSGVTDKLDFRLTWGNTAGILRWRRGWSQHVFGDISLYGTRYSYQANSTAELEYLGQDSTRTELDVTSLVEDVGLRAQFDILAGTRHYLRVGATTTLHHFVPETFSQVVLHNIDDTTSSQAEQVSIRSLESTVFVEENIQLGKRLRFNLGIHGSQYLVDSTAYYSLQPRLSARLELPFHFGVEGSFTSMVQYLHLLTNAGVGLPTDLWVPATSSIPPQRALQGSLGIEKQFPKANLEVGVEAYYKTMDNLIDYQTGINFLGQNDWQNLVETDGEGLAYGLECLMRRHRGRFTWTVGYTLSRSQRTFPTINFGETYLYKYDRTHDISVSGIYRINPRMAFSAEWMYGTGNAITFPQSVRYAPTSNILGFWDLNEGPNLNVIIDYGDRNSFRMPPYHRLDVNYSITWHRPKTHWTANIGIFNVYNRRNPYFLFLRADYSEDASNPEVKARKMSLLPILPALSVSCKF